MNTRNREERIKYIKTNAEKLLDRIGIIVANKSGHGFFIGEEVRVMLLSLGDGVIQVSSISRPDYTDRMVRLEDVDFPPNNVTELEEEKKTLQKLISVIDEKIAFLKENNKEFLNELEFNVKSVIKFIKNEENNDKATEFLVSLLKTKQNNA